MAEERLETDPEAPAVDSAELSDEQGSALRLPSWLPLDRMPRWLLIAGAAALVVALIVGTTLPFALGWLDEGDFKALGYPGIFLANFLGSATVFVPVPGLTAAGQALIVAESNTLNPVGLVFLGAAGMTLAETTAYLAGRIGRDVGEQREMPLRGRIGRWLRRAAGFVDRMMAHYGFVTLLVLAGIPNPLFEFAGITAGAVRMNFWRFLSAVAIGKTIRVILLVIIGQRLLDLFELG
jgi:membrane protein YqaA with SNARE-associated domain